MNERDSWLLEGSDLLIAVATEAMQIRNKPGFEFSDFAPFLSRLYREGFATQFINESLRPEGLPPGARPNEDEECFPILLEEDFNMVIKPLHRKVSDRLATAFCDVLIANVGINSVALPVYEIRGINEDTISYTEPAPLDTVANILLHPGDVQLFKTFHHLIDVTQIEGSTAVLMMSSAPRTTFSWVYDLASKKPESLTTHHGGLQTQFALRMLAEFNYADAAPLLEEFALKHDEHYIRWEAAKTLAAINPQLALPVLAKMVQQDECQQVVSAAQTAIKMLGGQRQ